MDLTAWANAEIHKLDADGWNEARRCAAYGRQWRDGYGDPVNRWTMLQAAALLAARDRVLAGLSENMRLMLVRVESEPQARFGWQSSAAQGLRRRKLLRQVGTGEWARYPLGHELACCIREGNDG